MVEKTKVRILMLDNESFMGKLLGRMLANLPGWAKACDVLASSELSTHD